MDFLELLAGLALAFLGGELFLKGVLGISRWARIPKAVTAATLAAFATSSPEISVAVAAGLAEKPQIALGDALGSNIVNVALILGLVLCLGPLRMDWKPNRREFGFALLVPFLILAALLDGVYSRWEAALSLSLFTTWLLVVLRGALSERSGIEKSATAKQGGLAIVWGVIGLALLILAGRLIVSGASSIGLRLGMDPFLIGATMVALGTSAPELATALVSKLRGHDEVGIGTILGSNIFNCLFIVGVTGLVCPIQEALTHVLPGLLMGVVTVACLAPISGPLLGRRRGVVLLLLYATSIALMWWLQPAGGEHGLRITPCDVLGCKKDRQVAVDL